MTDPESATNQPVQAGATGANGGEPAKAKFARALEEAKAGVQQLGKEAQEKASAYREKATATGSEMAGEAKEKGQQAKDKAYELANEGKAKASTAISGISKLVNDNAPAIDEKVGPKYGDYARSAAKSIQDAADWVEKKDLVELGEDAKEFVRKSPGLAIGLAAVAGFMLARMFRGGSSSD